MFLPHCFSKINGPPKPLEQRRDSKTKKDTFDLQLWWREATAKVPSWAYVLRAVLTNSPNSIPPERCFSILNDTFDDDQTRMVPTTSSTRSSRSTTRAAARELVLPLDAAHRALSFL